MDDNLFNFSSFLRALGSYRPLSVALELLIIGTVVFWVVRFLRGTRGARMLQGIAFLLFIFYLIVALVGKQDRKSTRLNSSHLVISYAVLCLKKKIKSN